MAAAKAVHHSNHRRCIEPRHASVLQCGGWTVSLSGCARHGRLTLQKSIPPPPPAPASAPGALLTPSRKHLDVRDWFLGEGEWVRNRSSVVHSSISGPNNTCSAAVNAAKLETKPVTFSTLCSTSPQPTSAALPEACCYLNNLALRGSAEGLASPTPAVWRPQGIGAFFVDSQAEFSAATSRDFWA